MNQTDNSFDFHTKFIAFTLFMFSALFSALSFVFPETYIPKGTSVLYIYYRFLLIVLTALTAHTFENCFKSQQRFGLGNFHLHKIFWIIILFIGFYIRYIEINTNPIWLDEYVQFILSSKGPFMEAATQQQPPFDYYLSALMETYFGVSETIARLPAFLFSCGTLIIAALLSQRAGFSRALTSLILLFFAFNKFFIRYSVEARPSSIGVFFSLLTLYTAYHVYDSDLSSKQRRAFSLSLLIPCTILFLNSIGLQPPAIVAFYVFYFACFSLNKRLRAKSLFLSKALLFSLLLSLPVLFASIIKSSKLDKFRPSLSFESIYAVLAKGEWFSANKWFYEFVFGSHLVTLLLIYLSLSTLFFRHNSSIEAQKKVLPIAANFSLFLFTASFSIFFYTVINWGLHIRYLICFVPFVLFNIALWIDYLQKNTELISKFILKFLSPPFLILIFLFLTVKHIYFFDISQHFVYNEDSKKIFQYLNTSVPDGSFVLPLNISKPEQWVPSGFVSSEFYFSPEKKDKVFFSHFITSKSFEKSFLETSSQAEKIALSILKRKKEIKHFYLMGTPRSLFPKSDNDKNSNDSNSNWVKDFNKHRMLHFPNNSGQLLPNLISYFEDFLNTKRRHPNYIRAHELLAYLYIINKDEASFSQQLEILRQLPTSLEEQKQDTVQRMLNFRDNFTDNT